MESLAQNPEFRNNAEKLLPWHVPSELQSWTVKTRKLEIWFIEILPDPLLIAYVISTKVSSLMYWLIYIVD